MGQAVLIKQVVWIKALVIAAILTLLSLWAAAPLTYANASITWDWRTDASIVEAYNL